LLGCGWRDGKLEAYPTKAHKEFFMSRWAMVVILLLGVFGHPSVRGEDAVFSGPQVGEKLPPFKVLGVFDDDAGKDLDFVTRAEGKPIVLIFVHDLNRQSISMTRVLSTYTVSRAADGLATGVVWLDDDVTEAENTLKRIRHALTPGAPTGISVDGREGPGSYGLNRNVMLTILVGKDGVTTANFALVQPSLQADLPKILQEVVRVAGGQVPKLEELQGMGEMMRRETAGEPDPKLRSLIRPVIRQDASAEEVDRAARAVEEYLAEHKDARQVVGRIANNIVDSGKLANYGTERAQEYLRKWAKEYGAASKDKPANETNSPRTDGGERK
jgi:hypothetical protein